MRLIEDTPAWQFQSTLPTRGSDLFFYYGVTSAINFNPRSPRGGATKPSRAWKIEKSYFNPRSPRGGATLINDLSDQICEISIHAPHEGERHAAWHYTYPKNNGFQSTLPTRGSDGWHTDLLRMRRNFNPRSPRGGATIFIASLCHIFANFNPRSPRGGATPINGIDCPKTVYFNPRSPRGGATPLSFSFVIFWYIFQSTLPTRGSDVPHFALAEAVPISIHAPHEGERRHQDRC